MATGMIERSAILLFLVPKFMFCCFSNLSIIVRCADATVPLYCLGTELTSAYHFPNFLHLLLKVNMSYCVDLVSEDSFYENVTLGVTKILEGDPRISNVKVERRQPCDRVAISTWEQRHSVSLPEDLRNFYASSDGFQLTWHYKYSADEVLPVGSISVNSLNNLCLSPSLKELLDFSITRQSSGGRPLLNTKSKVLELDSCKTIGKICLVYSGSAWSVWIATRDGEWGLLADSFTQYFRMALVHLGLPGWQAAFANLPLMPWAEQLFLLLAPHLLEKMDEDRNSSARNSEVTLNHIDPSIFKTSAKHHKKQAIQ